MTLTDWQLVSIVVNIVGNTSIIYQDHCHNKGNNYYNFTGRTIPSFPIASVINEIEWSYSTEVD